MIVLEQTVKTKEQQHTNKANLNFLSDLGRADTSETAVKCLTERNI